MNYNEKRAVVTSWLINGLTDPDKVRAIEEDLQTENSQVQEVLEEMAERARRVANMRDIGATGHAMSPMELPDTLDFTAPDENIFGRTKSRQTLPKRVRFAMVAITVGVVILGFLIPFWQSNANANLIKNINESYFYIDRILTPIASKSKGERRVLLRSMLPDFDQRLALFDRGAALQKSDPLDRLAKAKALLGRARLRQAMGEDADNKLALMDIEQARSILDSLPESTERVLALADAALCQSAILGFQQTYKRIIDTLNPEINKTIREYQKKPYQANVAFRLARLLSNRGNSYSGQVEHDFKDNETDSEEKKMEKAANRKLASRLANQDFDESINILTKIVQNGTADENALEWYSRIQGNKVVALLAQAKTASNEDAVKFRDEALKLGQEAVRIAEELVRDHPNSLSARDALAAASSNRGDSYEAKGNFTASEQDHELSLNCYEELYKQCTESREYIWGCAFARKNLGAILLREGKISKARKTLLDAQNRYKALTTKYKGVQEIADERAQVDALVKQLPPE